MNGKIIHVLIFISFKGSPEIVIFFNAWLDYPAIEENVKENVSLLGGFDHFSYLQFFILK